MLLPPPAKQRVRESFDRAAETYDGAATVQRWACHRLLDMLPEHMAAPARILDAGCGTGYGARLLRARWPRTEVVCTDFAAAMLTHARRESAFCFMADIENLPLPDNLFDIWWSNFTIQWCDNARVFGEAARALKPEGCLLASTLGPETFHEIREAFSSIDRYRHTLPFTDHESLKSSLEAAGFNDIVLSREARRVHYPDLKSLLHSIKEIGAQNVGGGARGGMMGRSAWQKLEETYENYRQSEGLPVSYDIVFCFARL